jgi:hypothetical protein
MELQDEVQDSISISLPERRFTRANLIGFYTSCKTNTGDVGGQQNRAERFNRRWDMRFLQQTV